MSSIQPPPNSLTSRLQNEPFDQPNPSNTTNTSEITLEEISSTGSCIKIDIPEGPELEKPTMQIIKELVATHGFSMNDIRGMKVRGVPVEERGSPKSVPVKTAHNAPVMDSSGKPLMTTENVVETWKHDTTKDLYAKIPIRYEIDLVQGEKKLSLQFDQPRYTNVKVPVTGTPHEQARFEKKLMAITVGVREEIHDAVMSRNEAKITHLATNQTSRFEYAYGLSNYFNGKKISPLIQKDPGKNPDSRFDIVGVRLRASTAVGRIIEHLHDPISINSFEDDRGFGRSHIGYMSCNALHEIDKARNECKDICLDISRARQKALEENEEISREIQRKEIVKQEKLHAHFDTQRTKIGDVNAVVSLEARSSVENMADIHGFLTSHAPLKKNTQSQDLEIDLQKAEGPLASLTKEAHNIQEFLEKIDQEVSQVSEEVLQKYNLVSEKKLDKTLLSKVSSDYEVAQVDLNSSLQKKDDISEQIKNLTEEEAEQKLPELQEKLQTIEKEIELKQSTLENMAKLKSAAHDFTMVTEHRIQPYLDARNSALKQVNWLVETMCDTHARLATVEVLYENTKNQFSDHATKCVQYLQKARKEYSYETLGSHVHAFQKAILNTPSSFEKATSLELEEISNQTGNYQTPVPHPKRKVPESETNEVDLENIEIQGNDTETTQLLHTTNQTDLQ